MVYNESFLFENRIVFYVAFLEMQYIYIYICTCVVHLKSRFASTINQFCVLFANRDFDWEEKPSRRTVRRGVLYIIIISTYNHKSVKKKKRMTFSKCSRSVTAPRVVWNDFAFWVKVLRVSVYFCPFR